MVTERTLQIGDEILKYAKATGLFVVHSRRTPMALITPLPTTIEVQVAVQWLSGMGLMKDGGDNSSYTITAIGSNVAGGLAAYVQKLEDREETAHRSNKANIKGVRNAVITAWASALLSLATLIYTICQANQ